jgi:hypothetical protein
MVRAGMRNKSRTQTTINAIQLVCRPPLLFFALGPKPGPVLVAEPSMDSFYKVLLVKVHANTTATFCFSFLHEEVATFQYTTWRA